MGSLKIKAKYASYIDRLIQDKVIIVEEPDVITYLYKIMYRSYGTIFVGYNKKVGKAIVVLLGKLEPTKNKKLQRGSRYEYYEFEPPANWQKILKRKGLPHEYFI